MNAAAQFHASVASACGFGIHDQARRAIDWIDGEVARGTPFAAALETARQFMVRGYYARRLVEQHYGVPECRHALVPGMPVQSGARRWLPGRLPRRGKRMNLTPGNWQAVRRGRWVVVVHAPAQPADICIADFIPTEADARVIAAAPMLVEAVQQGLAAAEFLAESSVPAFAAAARKSIEIMRAALTKAGLE